MGKGPDALNKDGGGDDWGDLPEHDAEATLAELELDSKSPMPWYDRAVVVPFKAVAMFIGRNGRRVGVTIAGILLLIVGIVGLALPVLPGWLLIFAGLAILSTEYVWADRALKRAKRLAIEARDKATRRSPGKQDGDGTGAKDSSDDPTRG